MSTSNIFNFFNYRILSVYDKVRAIKGNKLPTPQMAALHLTLGCNHNCAGCDYRALNKVRKILTPEQNDHIANEIIKSKIPAVEFSGGGEPLLDPYVPEMLYKFKENGIASCILTNGGLMTGRVLEAIIDCCSFVRISLESGSNEVFQRVKQVDNPQEFSKIIGNIEQAIKLKKEKGKDLTISLKFTVGKNNYYDLENAIKLAAELGVDSIQFKLYENAPDVQLSPGEAAAMAVKLHNLKKKYQKEVVILGDLKKSRLHHHCWLTPIYTLIDVQGDIYLCMYYHHRADEHKIGNIFDKPFQEIWGSEKHQQVLKNIDYKKCNIYDCRFHHYNALWDKIIENENDLKFV